MLDYLLHGSEHIYWILDLEGEVHSTWDLWISGLQECKSNGFFQSQAGGHKCSVRPKKLDFFLGSYLCPNLPPQKVRRGRLNILLFPKSGTWTGFFSKSTGSSVTRCWVLLVHWPHRVFGSMGLLNGCTLGPAIRSPPATRETLFEPNQKMLPTLPDFKKKSCLYRLQCPQNQYNWVQLNFKA